jgi:molybdenum cofactor cytidylyltransferase
MGELKQLLPLCGSTVLEQTLGNLRAAAVNETVLVLGSSAEIIRQRIADSLIHGPRVLVNPDYDQGMATSLQIGLSALDENTVAALTVLADQPFIRAETFDQIIDQYRRSNAEIVIPTYRGFRGNPVLLDRSLFGEVMALQGDEGCRAIFQNHLSGIIKVEVADLGVLLDIDNKDEYERMRSFGQTGQEETLFIEATRKARDIPESDVPS